MSKLDHRPVSKNKLIKADCSRQISIPLLQEFESWNFGEGENNETQNPKEQNPEILTKGNWQEYNNIGQNRFKTKNYYM